MARIEEPTQAELERWREWLADRPERVRQVAEQFDPWSLYRDKSSGKRVTLIGFDELEDGRVTVRVAVTGAFNRVLFDRQVFGIRPEDLEPCELPKPDEDLGVMCDDPAEVEACLDLMRAAMPDLGTRDDRAAGKTLN